MVQRVVKGPLPGGGHGIRISRPGFNVLDPALLPTQTSFDSNWNFSAKVYRQGMAHLAGGENVSPINQLTVTFGETLSEPPFVFATSHIVIYNVPGWNIISDQWQCIGDFGKSSGWPTNNPDFTQYRAYEAFTDRVVFYKLPGFGQTCDQKTFYVVIARE